MQHAARIRIAIAAAALLLPALASAQTAPVRDETLLREYNLPIKGYVDTGTPILVSGDRCTAFAKQANAEQRTCACAAGDTACANVGTQAQPVLLPVMESAGTATFRVQVPQAGLYKLEVTTANPGGSAFYYASDSQESAIWTRWMGEQASNLPAAFGGVWAAAERQQALRNYITKVQVDTEDRGFVFTPNKEAGNDQTGFVAVSLKAGEQDITLSLYNDLSHSGTETGTNCLPGDFSQFATAKLPNGAPACSFDRNVVYRQLRLTKVNETLDVIGIQIYTNRENLDPATWYRRRVVNAATSITPIVVDGYQGVKEGVNATYINAANVEITDDTANQEAGIYKGAFYTNIYKISFNVNSSAPTTKQVYDLMLQNWEFNTNLPENDPIRREQEKDKLRRDTLRLANIRSMREVIEAYRQRTGAYPRLQSGSYVPGHAVSTWPSWNAALGRELGASLPQDPLNVMVAQDQSVTAYDCTRTDTGALLDPLAVAACGAAAGQEAVVCSRADDGRALTACTAGQQCVGGSCSICPVGSDPQTCWDSVNRTLAQNETFQGCGIAYDGAFRLGSSSCTEPGWTSYDGAYVYQYTSANNGASYLLNYRLEWRSTTTCAADQCYYGDKCYAPGSCLAGCDPETGECPEEAIGLKNSVCVLGQWVQSCGDGFVQKQCGETCDPLAPGEAGETFCDARYSPEGVKRAWYTPGLIAARCTPQCVLEDTTTQQALKQIPPPYSPDPNTISCGGYCGDSIVQSRFGEQCDLGAASGLLKSTAAGGNAGVAEDSQYVCTGGGSATSLEAITDGGFESSAVMLQTSGSFPGLTGDWLVPSRIQTNSETNFGYQEVSFSRPDGTWVAYSGCRSAQDADCAGYTDSNLLQKRWTSEAALAAVPDADRQSYRFGAGNPASLSNASQPLLVETVSGISRSGSRSVRILDTGPKETALTITTPDRSIAAGAEYELSLYLRLDPEHYWKSDQGSPEAFVGVAFLDAQSAYVPQQTGSSAVNWNFARGIDGTVGVSLADVPSNSWTPVRMRLVAPTGATRARVVIKTDYYYRGAAFFVDDVSLATVAGCRTTGGWCGDGVVQSQYGEQCDTRSYLPPRPAETVNLLQNQSFDGVFAPWSASVQQAMRLAVDRVYYGSHSLFIDTNPLQLAPGFAAAPATVSQRGIQLFPETPYDVSIAVSEASGRVGSVSLRYGSASGSVTVPLAPASAGVSGWQRYAAVVDPEFAADSVAFVFAFDSGQTPAFYIDDAEIKPQRGSGAGVPQYRCGTERGAVCQFTGGYCGDGVAQPQYGEQCDDAVGASCTTSAQCGTGGSCAAGVCVSSSCNQYCAGSYCGDGIVQREGNAQGVREICDTKGDPTCSFDCRLRILGGSCQADFASTDASATERCAPGLTCAVRNYGDTAKLCLGTLGSYGCRSNNDCALGYYCDALKAKCEPEVPTYARYHGAAEAGRTYALPGDRTPYPLSYDIYGKTCPDVRTIQSGQDVYKLDRCTGLVWAGTDEITRDTWTFQQAAADACGGVFRLPTTDELYSLVRQDATVAPFTDKEGLKLCCASCGYTETEADLCQDKATDTNYIYWTDTCTERAADGGCAKAMAVNFKYGSLEEHIVTDAAKVRCVKQTQCGNGEIEEGEQCEFYTIRSADGSTRLLEQPIGASCTSRGWDAGSLHCDPQTCLLKEDNCTLASRPGLTCDQVCAQKDPALTCESVGTDLSPSISGASGTGEYFDITTGQYVIARDGMLYGAPAAGSGQCQLAAIPQQNACAYRFIAQAANCTIPGQSGQVPAPYATQYSYCNCKPK